MCRSEQRTHGRQWDDVGIVTLIHSLTRFLNVSIHSLGVLLVLFSAHDAAAQGFISPFVGTTLTSPSQPAAARSRVRRHVRRLRTDRRRRDRDCLLSRGHRQLRERPHQEQGDFILGRHAHRSDARTRQAVFRHRRRQSQSQRDRYFKYCDSESGEHLEQLLHIQHWRRHHGIFLGPFGCTWRLRYYRASTISRTWRMPASRSTSSTSGAPVSASSSNSE